MACVSQNTDLIFQLQEKGIILAEKAKPNFSQSTTLKDKEELNYSSPPSTSY